MWGFGELFVNIFTATCAEIRRRENVAIDKRVFLPYTGAFQINWRGGLALLSAQHVPF
jgi:hypothetical protein